jgi:hypothetical protein
MITVDEIMAVGGIIPSIGLSSGDPVKRIKSSLQREGDKVKK